MVLVYADPVETDRIGVLELFQVIAVDTLPMAGIENFVWQVYPGATVPTLEVLRKGPGRALDERN